MTLDEMKAAYMAQGGTVTRVPMGKRALRESYMADLTGDDDDRRDALERLADLLERKRARRGKRKARRALHA